VVVEQARNRMASILTKMVHEAVFLSELVLANTPEPTRILYLPSGTRLRGPVADIEKFSSILVFEEGYNLTTFSIYCGNDIR